MAAARLLDLRKGYPNPSEAPRELLARALGAVSARALNGELSLAYGGERGSARYLRALRSFLGAAEPSSPSASSWLLTTSGCSHGLELLASSLCRRGDVVVCESPTYFLAGQVWRDHGLRVATIESDAEGLRIDALAHAIEHEGLRPKLVYTVSSCANPSGATLPHTRRLALATLARRHRFWVVADEAYQFLRWAPAEAGAVHGGSPQAAEHGARGAQLAAALRPPRMATYDWSYSPYHAALGAAGGSESDADGGRESGEDGGDGVECGGLVSVGSFSKILSPALRVGWIEGRPQLIKALMRTGYVVSGGNPTGLSAEIVAEAVLSGDADRHLRGLCAAYRLRCAVLTAALRASEAEFTVQEPRGGFTGGYFVWVRLPEWAAHCEAVAKAALEAGVAVMPGTRCTALECAVGAAPAQGQSQGRAECAGATPGLQRHLRLCFAMLDAAELEEAVRRLSAATLATRPVVT